MSGCGGGGATLPKTAPASTDAGAANIARWQPVISADAGQIEAPPFAGGAVEQSEIAQLLELQNARTAAQSAIFNKWNHRAASQWNQIARDLVTVNNAPPPLASRVYAALGVAQLDATIAAARAQTKFNRAAPADLDARLAPLGAARDGYPSRAAALCRASADVLTALYPANKAQIESAQSECETSRLAGGVSFASDIEAGARVGDAAAARVLARLDADGADRADQTLPQPRGPGFWQGTGGLLPRWKFVKPWLTGDIDSFRAPAPPAFGSPQFDRDLAEVRQISDNRTPQQAQIAEFWADAAQTFTPPGHWNLFAARMIASHNLSDAQAARVYALLNMAEQDAGISCWNNKYTYWVLRPSQADPQITTPIGLPNFPSYTSGHSNFSGAAAQILGALFPDEKSVVDALAQEASISRVYGGIHYRFDADGGINNGRFVAGLAVARSQNDGYSDGAPTGKTLSFDELKRDTIIELNRRAPGAKTSANWD